MKYQPCTDKCSSEGTHCSGCGRSHEEIAGTKQLVTNILDFIEDHEYENPEEFLEKITKSVLKRL